MQCTGLERVKHGFVRRRYLHLLCHSPAVTRYAAPLCTQAVSVVATPSLPPRTALPTRCSPATARPSKLPVLNFSSAGRGLLRCVGRDATTQTGLGRVGGFQMR